MRRSLTALVAVFLLAACGTDTDDPEPTEAPTSAEATTADPTTEEPTPEAAALTVGGTTVLSVTADDTNYEYDVTAIRTEQIAGADHVLAEVTITVTAGELTFISGWHPGLTPVLVAGGTEYEQTGYETPDMFDGAIGAGETVSGTIGFEAPPEAAETGVYRLEVLSLGGPDVYEWTY